MKKFCSLILALVMALTCLTVAVAEQDKYILGFANNASDENMNKQVEAFQDYVDEWNAAGKTPVLEAVITNAESSVEKQISDVETLIEMGANVIYLHSVDLEGLKPAVDACIDAGVLVLEARGMDYDKVSVRYNSADEVMMAGMAFEWYRERMDADPDLVLNMGLIYGLASQTAQLVRVDHLVELLKEAYPDRVNVLASMPCDWDTQKAMECMENWLQRFGGEMNCVVAAGAMMACGAVNAVNAAGGDMDDWIFTTTDATSDVLWSINEGLCDMTVGIDAYAGGYLAAMVAQQMVMGEFEGDVYECGPAVLANIDSTNIADWYKG